MASSYWDNSKAKNKFDEISSHCVSGSDILKEMSTFLSNKSPGLSNYESLGNKTNMNISKTLNRSKREITRNSEKYYKRNVQSNPLVRKFTIMERLRAKLELQKELK